MQGQPELQKSKPSPELDSIKSRMKKLVVGQDDVISNIVDSFAPVIAGISDVERPLLNMLFLGPTGIGKTETVRALAEVMFGHRRAFTQINGQEYSAHYNISKLLGSPPGYVGGEIRPLLAQENIDRHHRKALENNRGLICHADSKLSKAFPPESERHLSIILFDEIEKAHPKLWNMLLGIMEDGVVVTGCNETVDFRNSIIICTSNVGSRAMSSNLDGTSMGFHPEKPIEVLNKDMHRMAIVEAKKIFSAEWLNRMDNIASYNVLSPQDLLDICDILIKGIIGRIFLSEKPFLLEFEEKAKNLLVAKLEGNNSYGARPLKRLLKAEVVTPISHYICNDDISKGDLVTVGVSENGDNFVFRVIHGIAKNDVLNTTSDNYGSYIRKTADDGGAKQKMKKQKGVSLISKNET